MSSRSQLTKHFDMGKSHGQRQIVHALDGVSLEIAEQEILGLVGESGSGKSTYGKALIGLHDKTSGEVRLKGETLPARYHPARLRTPCHQHADDFSGSLLIA